MTSFHATKVHWNLAIGLRAQTLPSSQWSGYMWPSSHPLKIKIC